MYIRLNERAVGKYGNDVIQLSILVGLTSRLLKLCIATVWTLTFLHWPHNPQESMYYLSHPLVHQYLNWRSWVSRGSTLPQQTRYCACYWNVNSKERFFSDNEEWLKIAPLRSLELSESSCYTGRGFVAEHYCTQPAPGSPSAAALIVHAFFPYGILVTVFIHHIRGFPWNLKVLPIAVLFLFHLTMTKEAKVWAL